MKLLFSWLISRVDNISFRILPFWNILGRLVSTTHYQKYWKLTLRTFTCQKYLGIYWKKWLISLFRQCPRNRGKLTIYVKFFSSSWVLIIQGLSVKTFLPSLTFGLIAWVLGRSLSVPQIGSFFVFEIAY